MSGSGKSSDSGEESHACPECGVSVVVEDIARGERVCGGCGLVLSDHRIDTGA
ncbi:MAG: transcription initiation factor IIB 2, partial [Candidatus Thorarchaeota archaeon]|nr:transcription initiation factor IIB 2 [Candidatus Thorarchaeota archaeon]